MGKQKISIAMVLLMTMLSGCGHVSQENTQQQTPQKETVDLLVWGGEEDAEILYEMTEAFKEYYSDQAEFNITIDTGNISESKAKMLENINEAADVFTVSDDHVIELASAGILSSIEDDTNIREANTEGSVESTSINNQMYAYPMTSDNGYFLFYNKTYFSEDDIQSLDKMLQVASKANKKITMDLLSGWYLYSFFGNTGLTLKLNDDGITNECNWNSTAGTIKGVDIGNAILGIANHSGFLHSGDEGLISGAKDGSVIAGISGAWSAAELEKIWGDNFETEKLPTYTCAGQEVQLASYEGYKLIGVNDYSEQNKWATKLAEWLTNEDNQRLRFERQGVGPSNKAIIESSEVQNSKAIQALLRQSQYASVQRIGASYWEPIYEYGKGIVEGTITSSNMQSALDNMVKEITKKVTE